MATYARVSSADQRGDLDRQVAGLASTRVVAEDGSALNGNRQVTVGFEPRVAHGRQPLTTTRKGQA